MVAAAERTAAELGPVWARRAIARGVGFGNGIIPLLDLNEAAWNWSIDVNLKGVWTTANACVPQMISTSDGGRLVTVSSAAGLRGARKLGAYAAAKAGVIALTARLPSSSVGGGSPPTRSPRGMIETQASQPVRDHAAARGRLDDMCRDVPLGRFGTPQEIAGAVSFLCSSDAAFITGDVVNLTGGQVMS